MNNIKLVFCILSLGSSVLHGCSGDEECIPNSGKYCSEGITYWVDSCGNIGEIFEKCVNGCSPDHSGCKENNCADLGYECGIWEGENDGQIDCGQCPQGEHCDKNGKCVTTWVDPDSGLTWQNQPEEDRMSWQDAAGYCRDLSLDGHDDWRLPSLGELRSLIRSCESTESGGTCDATDECLSYAECGVCKGCAVGRGPAVGAGICDSTAVTGCYYPDDLAGSAARYWSSSPCTDRADYFWVVDYTRGGIDIAPGNSLAFVKCVKCSPETPDCSDRECGSDGCGGTCSPGCVAGTVCNESSGQCEDCVESCSGKECGPDGCGGTCAPGCGPDEICYGGTCETLATNLTWISIPDGNYTMGSGDDDEAPEHDVTITAFEVTKTEITVAQYAACVDAGKCQAPDDEDYCNWNSADRIDHPVNCVDWYQASDFCTWAGGHLPSEAEWEYAARSAGKDNTFPWGDQPATCQYAVMWYDGRSGCGENRTFSVCSKTAGNTDQGLCDMAGNVSEWVQDWYHGLYSCDSAYGVSECELGGVAPADGSAWEDPIAYERILRGGSYTKHHVYMSTTHRSRVAPSVRARSFGFRCVRP